MAITVKRIKQLDAVTDVPKNADLIINTSTGDTKRATVDDFAESINTTFTGTTAEWEALTAAQKAKYTIVNLTDDTSGGGTVITDAYDVEYKETTVGDQLDSDAEAFDDIESQINDINDVLDILLEDITYTLNVSTAETTLFGGNVTISYGGKTETKPFSAQGNVQFKIIKYTGDVSITSTDGEDTATSSVTIESETHSYNATLAFTKIYGVSWAGTEATTMTRTDGAAGFSDPSPAVNNGTGSSPFDVISPWKDIKVVDDATAGKLVEIPKYYYKWTKTGTSMTLQISEKQEDGFLVSPAHADRGDSVGERDVVYVGRYHCANSTYKSTTGVTPQVSQTRSTFRTSIHNLGSTYWQYDFAMYWTIMMLYLVEYANWNSQAVIGYGCAPDGSTSAVRNMGYTDSMQYHTGTTAADRTTYGGTQYRYIEGLWDNCYDWCDGIYFSGTDIYCIKKPSSFSDTSGGTKTGVRPSSSNYISAWDIPSASGFEYALYPSAVAGSASTYIGDYCYYVSSGVVLRVGGFYGQYQDRGAFCLSGNVSATVQDTLIGGRLQKLFCWVFFFFIQKEGDA